MERAPAESEAANRMAGVNVRLAVILAILAACAAALYLPGLHNDDRPLTGDELFAALTAHSIAATGRDLNGRFLPLFFQMPAPFRTEYWFPPIPIYCMAALLKALPLSEGTIRLPMTYFAIIDVLLVYLVARQLFGRESLAIGAAALLALTPAHYYYSRLALDFAAPLPFVLGWLLCLVKYLDGHRRAWLLGAGLMLGIGLYTYVAAVVLLPLYAILTGAVLYARRERLGGFLTSAAGFMLPASLALIVLLGRSTVAADMFTHYQHGEGQFDSAPETSTGLAVVRRLADYGQMYASFWAPRLWFIVARQSPGLLGGLFLFPVAGFFVAAILRLATRPTLKLLLLIGGFICAPLPASLTPAPEVVHRLLPMLPFGALLAAMGLEHVSAAETPRARTLAFAAVWGSLIGLAVIYHDELHNAQAIIRAATVPLAVTGLAVLLAPAALDRARFGHVAGAGLLMLIPLQLAYLVVPPEIVVRVSIALLAAIGLAPLWPDHFGRISDRPLRVAAFLAVIASLFIHFYVDRTNVPWLPSSHATATLLTVRFLATSAALTVVMWLVRRVSIDRSTRGSALVATIALVTAELAYYYIDYSTDFPIRFIQATVVLAIAAGLARHCRGAVVDRLTLGQFAAASLFALAATQFAYFYVTPGHPQNAEIMGQRAAFEAVIARVHNRVVPAVYVGRLGPFAGEYWRFAALKHGRHDLVPRTIVDAELSPNRIAELPAGSIAIVGHSVEAAQTVPRLTADGRVITDVIHAEDGSPQYWILERTNR